MKKENLDLDQDNYTVFCPVTIVEDSAVTGEELRTYLLISNFLKKSGFALCSDKWIAEKQNCTDDTIQRHLKSLEEKGYLYRQTWKEGMYWKRRIWLPAEYMFYIEKHGLKDEKFEKFLRALKSDYSESSHLQVSSRPRSLHNNQSTIITKTDCIVAHARAAEKSAVCEISESSALEEKSLPPPETFQKTDHDGLKHDCNLSLYLAHCLKTHKSFTINDIKKAWEILFHYHKPISSWMAFLDGTCANIQLNLQKEKTNKIGRKTKKNNLNNKEKEEIQEYELMEELKRYAR